MIVQRQWPTVLATGLLLLAVGTDAARAQRPVTPTDSLRMRLDSLRQEVDSLRALLARLQPDTPAVRQAETDTADDRARIRAAAAAAVGDTAGEAPSQPPEFEGRQRNLSALNPEITVTGDVFAFANSKDSDSDNFVPREFELSLISNLDPYSRAKIFVAHHSHGGEVTPFPEADATEEEHEEGSSTEIEEGYVEWVSLPGGIGVTVGKFRQRFGKLNRWHAHALPTQQLPLPYLAFFGEEGLAQAGVSVHWLAPIHGLGTYEVWMEATRSDNPGLFGSSNGPSLTGHINGFWELSPATYLELGVSGITGGRDDEALPAGATSSANRVLGVDFTFDWRPPDRALYRQFTLHGGTVMNRRAYTGADDVSAWGAFVQGEYKFARQWIAGARYEYTENPDQPDQHAWLAGPTLTWWQSEFVRLRGEYQLYRGPVERYGQLVLQATFAMGPHKHESY